MYKSFDENSFRRLLAPADALIIVPPITPYSYEHPTIGPHVLQSCAKKAGFSVTVFYADIHFMACMGIDHYRNMGNGDPSLLGENIFASSAHGVPGIKERFDIIYNYPAILGAAWPSYASQFKPFHGQDYRFSEEELGNFEDLAARWIEKTADFVSSLPYKIIGCSTSFEQINASFGLLKKIKEKRPDTVTLLGGGQCTGKLAKGIRSLDGENRVVDYVFSGESEGSFVRLLEQLQMGEMPEPGIITGTDCLDLNGVPEPNFSEYFEQLAFFIPEYKEILTSLSLPYETSRGCWWRKKRGCNFCGEKPGSYRKKSAEKVFAEITDLTTRYETDLIKMTDVVMPGDYFKTLLPLLAEHGDRGINISYYLRPALSLKQIKLLKNAGVTQLMLGIESLSPGILKKINKGASISEIIRSLRYTRALSILVQWNILWGIPGDTREEYQEMLELLPLIRHLQPPFGFIHLRFDNFSNYANEPEFSISKNTVPMESYRAVFPEYADFGSLARYFKADYPSAAHSDPAVIIALEKEVGNWFSLWKEGGRMCHLFPGGDGGAMLLDTRGLEGVPGMSRLTKEQVETVLTGGHYSGGTLQDWAVSNKLAVVAGEDFIPLVTAPVELFEEVENKSKW